MSTRQEPPMIIRNWQDATPYVGHETAIIWTMLSEQTADADGAVLQGLVSVTRHMMQAGKSGDYHDHDGLEQVYYITKGRGDMKLDGQIHPVKQGDCVHLPPKCKHQLINNSEDWIEHLIITARVPEA
ncbi:MAG: hypothetical protein CMJ49_03825 [Planctomycetaceae bacterium]|nr:hypothetical protein [Planctomycetaceae bacterium]